MEQQMNQKNGLPNKLSDLLELAMKDVRAIEEDPRYRLDMSHWHMPSIETPGVCLVCMAGAVMANTLEISPTQNFGEPHILVDYMNGPAIRAIDLMRKGAFEAAHYTMGGTTQTYEPIPMLVELQNLVRGGIDYSDGHAAWEIYDLCVEKLRTVGL